MSFLTNVVVVFFIFLLPRAAPLSPLPPPSLSLPLKAATSPPSLTPPRAQPLPRIAGGRPDPVPLRVGLPLPSPFNGKRNEEGGRRFFRKNLMGNFKSVCRILFHFKIAITFLF
jgi:hypothetical protein